MQRAKPRRSGVPRAAKIIGGLTLVWVLAVFSWATYAQPVISYAEKPLTIWMFDVGQGDAMLIQAPTGEELLIDGGRDDMVLSKLGSVLAPWDRELEAVLLTHPDADHGTGLISVLEYYNVNTIYESGARAHTQTDTRFVEAVAEEGTQQELLQEGEVVDLGNVQLTVLSPEHTFESTHPENRNDASVVLLLEYGETSILLMGDAEEEVEEQLQRSIPDIDILKVGHHGSLTSSTWNFLQQVRPEFSLISAGTNNSYGHPHPIVIERLNQIESQVYRTDVHTDVRIQSWGGEPEVEVIPLPF
jgi:competence protein ComEC